MLSKFAVTNYRGFPDRIELDLSKPRDYEFNPFAVKNGIIKDAIIYGKNGSGKTNLGMAIFDIVNHLSQKWKKPDYYVNFIYAGEPNKPVCFEYTFKFDEQILQYNYSKNPHGQLLEEKLTVDSKLIFEKKQNSITMDNSFPMEQTIKYNLTSNVNRVSIVNFLLTSYPLAENHFLLKLQDFVNSMLWFRCLDVREFIGLEPTSNQLDEYIIKNNLVKDFKKFLLAVSEQEFDFIPHNQNDKVLFCFVKGKPTLFHQIASTGTNSLELLYFWLKHLDLASFVCVDEFDAFYHFKLSFEVCKRLFDLNCQVLLSSHNTFLMTNDLLRPDCNFVLNNNKIKSLCDATDKELREGHNIEKLYRGGTFEI